ncbi:hypothetical protein Hdeb2414_s0039g00735141 [Helianthus debilis subsp. tardiflorus]
MTVSVTSDPSISSSSFPINSILNNCLFGHLCVGVNLSLHQKHSPLDLLAAISLVVNDLVLVIFEVVGEGSKGR